MVSPTRDDFRTFYDRAFPVVYSYFRQRMGGDPDLAKDLTQETFAPSVWALPEPDGTRTWLFDYGTNYGINDDPGLASLVDLETGGRIVDVAVASNSIPVIATADGLYINSHEWIDTGDGFVTDDRTTRFWRVTPDGVVEPLAEGSAVAARGRTVVSMTRAGPDGLNCALHLTDLVNGIDRLVAPEQGLDWSSFSEPGVDAISPDGRFVIVWGGDGTQERSGIYLVEIETGELTGPIAVAFGNKNGPSVIWTGDGEWIVLLGHKVAQAVRVRDLAVRDLTPYLVPTTWVAAAAPTR